MAKIFERALKHVGYSISDQTVGNILKRHGIPPAPERKKTTTWNEFIRSHLDVLVATDFFTTEVWTWCGLVTYYILFFLHVGSRRAHIAGVTRVPLPPRSPNLNAFAERWVRSVKSEALSKLILFGERTLRHALKEYTTHVHEERPHQGIGNIIPFPAGRSANDREGPIACHERLGGLLKYYDRQAA